MNEKDYGAGMFNCDQFAAVAAAPAGIRGRFVLSLNDRPEVCEIFAAFEFPPAALSYGISSTGPTAAREVIITDRR